MIIPKKERNKFYKKALAKYADEPYFLCATLSSLLFNTKYYELQHNYDGILVALPELANQKPKKKFDDINHEGGWWPLSDYNSRIKALKACIRATNPKPKKK